MSNISHLTDHVLEMSEEWRRKATLLAFTNPLMFLVVMGCTLPQYLEKIDQLEEVYRQIKERAA